MVVLAGAGHLAYGSGIPHRTARRNGFPYTILLNDREPEKGVAHFIVNPGAVPFEGTPRLMVNLAEEKGQVVIQGFSHGSVSEKAGMRKGDVILSLDGTSVQSVEEIRIDLLFRKKGERIIVRVLRKEAPVGVQAMEFEVPLH
jgi:S1-C subfamily serine protease